jgi:hypothetical protein
MMRQDQNASLWAMPAPRGRKWLRRLAFGGVGAIVAVIAGLSLIEQVTPLSASTECGQAGPTQNAGCRRDTGPVDVTVLRSIRAIGPDRTAAAVTTSAPPPASSMPVAPAAILAVAPTPVGGPAARSAPSTDGAGRAATVAQPQPAIAIADEELTFKSGAMHRSAGALRSDETAKPPAPPQKRARAASRPQRNAAQTYELPDGRSVTVHRGRRDDDADGRRLRAAEAGRRYGGWFGGADGERRGSWGLGGLY